MTSSRCTLLQMSPNREKPLENSFACPFCLQEKSCCIKMDIQANTAYISCNVCSEDFQTVINYLTKPSDVYKEWIKTCQTFE
jgi:transcription elongation factor Elf1